MRLEAAFTAGEGQWPLSELPHPLSLDDLLPAAAGDPAAGEPAAGDQGAGEWEVEIADKRYPAQVSLSPLYDPKNERIKM